MGNKVFIANIPFNKTESQLETFIREQGKHKGLTFMLQEVKIVKDPEGNSKGFGFITFSKDLEASMLIGMAPLDFDGRKIVVKEAQEKKRSSKPKDPQSVHSFMDGNKGVSQV